MRYEDTSDKPLWGHYTDHALWEHGWSATVRTRLIMRYEDTADQPLCGHGWSAIMRTRLIMRYEDTANQPLWVHDWSCVIRTQMTIHYEDTADQPFWGHVWLYLMRTRLVVVRLRSQLIPSCKLPISFDRKHYILQNSFDRKLSSLSSILYRGQET